MTTQQNHPKVIRTTTQSTTQPEKKMGMEERIPTMPGVFNNSYRITRTWQQAQAYYSKATYQPRQQTPCPRCANQQPTLYDHYTRRFYDTGRDGSKRTIILKARRFKCPECSHVFREPIEGVSKWQRSSQRYRRQVAREYRKQVNNKTIAFEFGVSPSTVERIIHEQYQRKINEVLSYPCPTVLGIDEHSIHKGYKFATTITDLKHHRVYDIIQGKSRASIESTLTNYPGRQKVKVVCMDLNGSYRSIVRRCFPNALIVADRFHVIRLVTHHFMEFCKQAQEAVKWNRKLTHPLRKKAANLSQAEQLRLNDFFKENPAIKLAYDFKQQLADLLGKKAQTARQCRHHIRKLKAMIDTMKHDAPHEFARLAQTLTRWLSPIMRMWRFTKNNAITEGFHRKMKLIQRRAYGYRNFQNYRLRVLVECGVDRL